MPRNMGMKNGLSRLGPAVRTVSIPASSVSAPPMPDPISTPTRSALLASIVRPDASRASSAARDRVVRVAVCTASVLATQALRCVETLDLGSERGFVAGGVETSDGSDPGLAGHDGGPGARQVITERRNGSCAGDDDVIWFHEMLQPDPNVANARSRRPSCVNSPAEIARVWWPIDINHFP